MLHDANEPPRSSRRDLIVAVALFFLALCIRLPALSQSLWYDESITLLEYIGKSWDNVFRGQYSPNNHVLFTVLAKLITPDWANLDTVTFLIRVPSLVAGSLVPIALARPLRKSHPLAALFVALIATLHPWLIASSANARGYALLLLLSILSTNLLPTRRQLLDWKYSLLLLLTVYTQPLGVGVAVGHGVAMLLLRRELFITWFRSASLAGVITIALYFPMFSGARDYWTAPEKPSVTYVQFLDQSFRYAQAGYDARGIVHLLCPLLVLTLGTYFAWRERLHPAAVVTYVTASVFGIFVALVIPLAGEVRALHWLIPAYIFGAAGILTAASRVGSAVASASSDAKTRTPASAEADPTSPRRNPALRFVTPIALAVLLIILSLHTYAVLTVPNMPIRDAVERARVLSNGRPLIGLHMASREARILYAPDDLAIAYALDDRPSTAPNQPALPGLRPLESQIPSPTLVVFYESFIQRDEPELWNYLRSHYTLADRLPGRVSPAAIYRRK